MRPKAIVTFEWLYLLTLAIGTCNAARVWPQLAANTAPGTLLVVQLFTFGLTLLLVLLTARRRSRVASVILIAAFLIGLPVAVEQLRGFGAEPLSAATIAVQLVLQASALLMLVTPTGRAWLWSGKRRSAGG